jgi:predicted metal-dependent HD superfamily phosphohydrolase
VTDEHRAFDRSWKRAWRGIGANADGSSQRAALLAAYREPQRHYHTLQHLGECITLFETCGALAERPAEVELALWFHDAVYDVRRGDNERRSADWSRAAAIEAGSAAEVGERLAALVMATRHDVAPASADEKLLVDIDLAILAADAARFAEYERQIRAEYAHVDDTLFRARRRAILAGFLARDAIYATPVLHDKLEARGRANLARAIGGDEA